MPDRDADRLYQNAVAHALAGRIGACAKALHELLARVPDHVEGQRMLGKLLLQTGQAEQGRRLLEAAALREPDHPELAYETGVAALQCHLPEAAEKWFRRQLATAPDNVAARYNLAWTLRRMGKLEEAVAAYREVLAREPEHGRAWFNLANALTEAKRFDEAAAAFDRALATMNSKEEVLANAAIVQLRLGNSDKAGSLIQQAGDRQHPLVLAARGELLMAEGRHGEALKQFSAALDRDPANLPSLQRVGDALRAVGRPARAVAHFRQALKIHPDDPGLRLGLAQAALAAGDMGEAMATARDLLGGPLHLEARVTLGKALALCSRTSEAAAAFREVLAERPDLYAVHSNLLFCLLHDETTPAEDVFAEHEAYGRLWESRYPDPQWRPTSQGLPERRLRVGYVSPDFCEHAVTFFFEPLLDHHDRKAVEIVCYHIPQRTDAVTERLRRKADHWRVLPVGDIDRAIRTVREDRIDILFDLAGHTAGNMLPVFAAKPAPIQVSGIGYPGTTGLTRIDYRLTYGGAPKQADDPRFSTEKLVTLPSIPFQPPAEAPEVAPPPLWRKGHPTFGSFGKYAKVGPRLRELWARMLAALPAARLLVVAAGGEDEAVARAVRADFAAFGADAERIDVVPERPFREWLALFAEIDVLLATFPYPGGTTTRMALWMGVPVVRLWPGKENKHAMPILCGDEDDYVATAAALASDGQRLGELRANLRARQMLEEDRRSRDFARELEAFYRRAWGHWLGEEEAL